MQQEIEDVTFLRDRLSEFGCPKMAAAIPFTSYNCVKLANNIWFSIVHIKEDSHTPYGVFTTSAAVDKSKDCSLRKAIFEACERYILAASDYHTDKFTFQLASESDKVFRSPYKFRFGGTDVQKPLQLYPTSPFGNHRSRDSHVYVTDCFAPISIKGSFCNFLPSTNGVACGSTFDAAVEAAVSELVERDSIMRFWYMGQRDGFFKLNTSQSNMAELAPYLYLRNFGYDLYFLKCNSGPLKTVFTIAIHKSENFPFSFCSAGTKMKLDDAIESSLNEAVQTLVALSQSGANVKKWLESEIGVKHLEHHMYYYSMRSLSENAIKGFLYEFFQLEESFAGTADENSIGILDYASEYLDCSAVDLTPDNFSNELSVCRVLSSNALPLFIGETLPPKDVIENQLRLPFPHPFP
ncbi:TPA: YcaO-like family protein [Vibrio fluvialis]|uniref:YcaO-like family protein n=2 Tax=Vibrio fluvialis TaxID=676 RepID=UPI001C9BF004|nr:YcaO-like family protein [Vibrio fluvialis]EKO3445094.1 YcaO-like family protein [Vibrio fluvialis]EKO3998363.1 hypothetical protein [Vibrio fluvialis]MBY7998479.1 YcaO-like family protein [Vibrio fluvialis]MCG6345218.1 YcaO-like family protein [Vibrio fluvialis]